MEELNQGCLLVGCITLSQQFNSSLWQSNVRKGCSGYPFSEFILSIYLIRHKAVQDYWIHKNLNLPGRWEYHWNCIFALGLQSLWDNQFQQLLETHSGWMNFSSMKGVGATFCASPPGPQTPRLGTKPKPGLSSHLCMLQDNFAFVLGFPYNEKQCINR